ncbi:MAG: sulfatase [Saprospiraceae bacterium]|nr:sulfatase [Saprospiraceae bacterium]
MTTNFRLILCLLFIGFAAQVKAEDRRPNILVIMIDDLNDCLTNWGGHAQSLTPNMSRFADSAARFKRAYTNAPMCGPSRASLFTGIYPHHSRNYYQAPWLKNEVLSNSKTMMEYFKAVGYNVFGSGKIMHHNKADMWTHFENPADYSPTPFDGQTRLPHPDVPAPFADIGWVDGSLGPFINLAGRTSEEGKPLHWTTGNPKLGYKPMRYINDEDRDPTPDEINAQWAADQLKQLATTKDQQPFFLAVGFLRPHTPLVAPQKYFDLFPLEDIELAVIQSEDAADTHLKIAYKDGDVHALRFGKEMFEAITAAYGSTEAGLKKWTQAYLACVAAVDDNVGQVLDALEESTLADNTIVVLASDHGFHMGEKDYLYKNSLWEESTRVPLMMRVPGLTQAGSTIQQAVSLVDVYPTLLDLCGFSASAPISTLKTAKGHQLDGYSMSALLKNPNKKSWKGSKAALSAVYAGQKYKSKPADQHYAIRTNRFRYILYNTGHEELYDHQSDPYEWKNVANQSGKYQGRKRKMRKLLQKLVAPVDLSAFSHLPQDQHN